jgi:transposase
MADLPEIGLISNKAISKLVGVAPLAKDSGGSHARRAVRGGRARVREILFLVAEVVRRHDPNFANFNPRMRGKPKKVIRVALAPQASGQTRRKSQRNPPRLASQCLTNQTVAHPVAPLICRSDPPSWLAEELWRWNR